MKYSNMQETKTSTSTEYHTPMTREVKSIRELQEMIALGQPLVNLAFQNMDLTSLTDTLINSGIRESLFLGCLLENRAACRLQRENYIFPIMDLPYPIYPNRLYSAEDLYENYVRTDPDSFYDTTDQKIYRHFIHTGKYTTDIKESLARSLHDQSITSSLEDFIIQYDPLSLIAVMGGHQMSRRSSQYRQIVFLSKYLTEKGKLMLSGGGPGAMEATHVGAWLAGQTECTVLEVLKILGTAPDFEHENWLNTAFYILENFEGGDMPSLGIPTWLYGHEPPTPFATHIAKYFTNSIREEGLLALAKGGVIFTPGSAGTSQEVFQEVTQNHYLTLGIASPMIFFDSHFWTEEWPVYPVLEKLHKENKLQHLDLGIYDQVGHIVAHLNRFYDRFKNENSTV